MQRLEKQLPVSTHSTKYIQNVSENIIQTYNLIYGLAFVKISVRL